MPDSISRPARTRTRGQRRRPTTPATAAVPPPPAPGAAPAVTPARPRVGMDRDTLLTKLHAYGWLDKDRYPTPAHARAQATRHDVAVAVKAYQGFHGLEVDGWAGPETERSLHACRFCGLPDMMPDSLELNRWPNPNIKWWLDTSTLGGVSLDAAAVGQAFAWAWAEWAAVCNITPQQVQDAGQANVRVVFGAIDGPGRVLAWSELADNTENPHQQRFDSQERWAFAPAPPQFQLDLGRVACHEIGHVLGLPHIAAGNLLQPTYDPNIRIPQAGDVAEVQARYGRPAAAPVPPTGPTGPPNPPNPPAPPTPGAWTVSMQGTGDLTGIVATGFRITRNN